MSQIKAIIFDLDGTLIDSVMDLANSVNYSLQQLGLEPHSHDEIRSFVGDGVQKLIKRSLGPKHLEKFDRGFTIFMNHYGSHCTDNTVLYPGVAQILPQLAAEYILGILTNKSLNFTQKILQALNIAPYFKEIVGGDSLTAKKPDPAGIFYLAEKWGLDPAAGMIMVGDHATDIRVGQRAGCKTVFIAGKIGQKQDLNPDYIIGSMTELPELLANLKKDGGSGRICND